MGNKKWFSTDDCGYDDDYYKRREEEDGFDSFGFETLKEERRQFATEEQQELIGKPESMPLDYQNSRAKPRVLSLLNQDEQNVILSACFNKIKDIKDALRENELNLSIGEVDRLKIFYFLRYLILERQEGTVIMSYLPKDNGFHLCFPYFITQIAEDGAKSDVPQKATYDYFKELYQKLSLEEFDEIYPRLFGVHIHSHLGHRHFCYWSPRDLKRIGVWSEEATAGFPRFSIVVCFDQSREDIMCYRCRVDLGALPLVIDNLFIKVIDDRTPDFSEGKLREEAEQQAKERVKIVESRKRNFRDEATPKRIIPRSFLKSSDSDCQNNQPENNGEEEKNKTGWWLWLIGK